MIDESKNEYVLQALVDFIGDGDVSRAKALIDSSLNRSTSKISKMPHIYPLSDEINQVVRILDDLKVKADHL